MWRTRAMAGNALLLAGVLVGLLPVATFASTLAAGFVETRLVHPLDHPTAMAVAPDGRLFVAEQGGRLRIIKNGVLLDQPFLTVTTDNSGERGLVGVAVDPAFATNQYVYIYYTALTPTVHNRVSRFTASGDVAVAGSETVLIDLDDLSSAIQHNGGALQFGPDGALYIAVGDNQNGLNAQSMSTVKGKILRINPDGTIPADNPFYATALGNNRAIWALGLRNPFTFDFQPGSGRMFINDVGQDSWEEINEGVAGANYGWPDTEGYTSDPRFSSPLFAYPHGAGVTSGCGITGGAFYNPISPQFPSAYVGQYFFIDFCNGWIQTLDPSDGFVDVFATDLPFFIASLTVGIDGSLYYLQVFDSSFGPGALYRIQYTGSLAPSIGRQPASQIASVGYTATFTIEASGYEPLRYQWQLDGVDIPGATSATYTTPPLTISDNGGQYRCIVSNDFGSATSDVAILTVTTDQPPVATITAPAEGTLFSAGDTITFQGTADDPETGALPPSAFTWRVDFVHDGTHVHPFVPATSGITGGTFTIPLVGETSPDVFYRIYLTVTDPAGLTTETYRDILPRLSTFTLASSPPGLLVTLEGQPRVTPASVLGLVNLTRTLGAPSPQAVLGTVYEFVSWSDGGAATHDISTPATDTTYTAIFRNARQGTISASPNPIQVCDGSGLGVTTLTWTATGVTAVEVHVNSPTGALFASRGPGTYSAPTGKWVSNGMTFYLQDVSGGKPGNTLASVTVTVTTDGCVVKQITASPNPIQVCDGSGVGVTTIAWTPKAGVTNVEVHINSPTGPLFSTIGPNGTQTTGKWVSDGMVFYLQNVTGGLPLTAENTLDTVTVRLTTTGCSRTGSITASPNPVQVCDGTLLGQTTLNWTSSGTLATEVHVNSPTGALFASRGPGAYSATTGNWVSNGMTFYLQDVSGGLPLTAANTLATVGVGVTDAGCLSVLTWSNPPDITYGTALSGTQLNATASVPGTFVYSPPAGTVLNAGAQMLSVTFTPTDTTKYATVSKTVSLNVLPATLTIKADDKTKVFGAPLPAFTVTPTGFVNGDTMAGLGGTLSFTTAATMASPVGAYSVTPGGVTSPNYVIGFVSGTLTVIRAPTASSLAPAPNPSGFNQAITLTSTVGVVAPGAGVPTGMVNFFDGSTLLGSASVTNNGGSFTASLIINGLSSGTHALSASYQGDASFAGSTSSAVSQVVKSTANSTTIALTSGPDPSALGHAVTITATVSRQSGSGTPTGVVRFFDLETATLLGTAVLSNGTGQLTTTSLTLGTHFLTGTYLGDNVFAGSNSSPISQTVYSGTKPRSSSTTLASSANPAAFGQAVTFTAKVHGKNVSGDVQLTIDGVIAGWTALTPTGADSGIATFNISGLARGLHIITAQYLGNAASQGSSSSDLKQQVQ